MAALTEHATRAGRQSAGIELEKQQLRLDATSSPQLIMQTCAETNHKLLPRRIKLPKRFDREFY